MVRNDQLRQQLEESYRTNAALVSDFHKLTDEWQHMREEIMHKEDELKEEEQVTFLFQHFFLHLHAKVLGKGELHPFSPFIFLALLLSIKRPSTITIVPNKIV